VLSLELASAALGYLRRSSGVSPYYCIKGMQNILMREINNPDIVLKKNIYIFEDTHLS
jgi:hypothetical protein